jgi:hypothetical protein
MERGISDREPRNKAHMLFTRTDCWFSGDCGMDGVYARKSAEGVEVMMVVGALLSGSVTRKTP